MRFDVAAVDGKLVGNGDSGHHLLEDALPDATLRPPIVTVIDRCRRPIDGRNVAPSTARLQDMQDARDDRAVVDARLARPAARQLPAARLPRLIPPPEQAPRHDDRLLRLKSGANIEPTTVICMGSLPRVQTQSGPPDDDGCERDGGSEV